jgi:hypothetical protein
MEKVRVFVYDKPSTYKIVHKIIQNFEVLFKTERYSLDVYYDETLVEERVISSMVTLLDYKQIPLNIRPEVAKQIRCLIRAHGIKVEFFEETDDDQESI